MNILRGIARWLCVFGIGLSLGAWILSATLNATVLNREIVKNWLAQSGVYNTGLNAQIQMAADDQSGVLITNDMLQEALAKTFNAQYLQQNVGLVIDRTYDWLEGKAQTISFSIPVQEKTDEFAANLAALVEPKLAALPACTSRLGGDPNRLTCLPPGVEPADYATQLTKQAGGAAFLNTPLTEQSLRDDAFAAFSWLPIAVQTTQAFVWSLPIAILLLGGLYVLASKDKLQGAGRVGRQITISASITLIGSLVVWFGGSSLDLRTIIEGGDAQQAAVVDAIVNPLVHTILPDFGRAMSLYSGIAAGLGGVLWVGMWLLARRPKTKLSADLPPQNATNKAAALPKPEVARSKKIL